MLAWAVLGLVAFCSMVFAAVAEEPKRLPRPPLVQPSAPRTHAKKGQIRITPKSDRDGHTHRQNTNGEPLSGPSEKTAQTGEEPPSQPADDAATTDEKPLPEFPQIEKAAADYFAGLPGYQPGGVITRPEAQGFFAELEKLGWNPDNRQEILANVPPPDDFLVQELRTRSGRQFTGRIATYPQAFDRLERLSRLAYGKEHVKGIIGGPGGDRWIKYITTDKRGIELSQSMSRAKNGADFDKPTGRIYTVQMLLEQLQGSYQRAKAEVEPALASGSPIAPPSRSGRGGGPGS
jgi:hypothetical protein